MKFATKVNKKVKQSAFLLHETKKHTLKRFLLVAGVFFSYLLFVCWKYGVSNGISVALLSWTFFVFCTPIADAGFLVDFPVRLLTGIRMIHSEMMVWAIAFFINAYSMLFNPLIYEKTELLKLFQVIITHPIPFWLITIVSAIGTFLSVYFGDELIDVANHSEREKYKKHKKKHLFIVLVFLIIIIIILYQRLLQQLGVSI